MEDTVGIRDLKAHLSRHLRRVRSGVRLLVTDRGRSIAAITPVDPPADLGWAHQFVAEGRAQWNGARPSAGGHPVTLSGRMTAASVVLQDRR